MTQIGSTLHGNIHDYIIDQVYPDLFEVKQTNRQTGRSIWYGPFKTAIEADQRIGKTESYLQRN